jgi:hypothetical protein
MTHSQLRATACIAAFMALSAGGAQQAHACLALTNMYSTSDGTTGISGGSPMTVASCNSCTVTCSGVNGGKPETVTVVSSGGDNTGVITLTGGPYGSCKNFFATATSADKAAICKSASGCSKLTVQNSGTAGGTKGGFVGTATCP